MFELGEVLDALKLASGSPHRSVSELPIPVTWATISAHYKQVVAALTLYTHKYTLTPCTIHDWEHKGLNR